MSDNLKEIAEDSARGGFFLFSGSFVSLLILAVGSILIARLLGQDNYGLYSLAIVAPQLLVNSLDFGINYAITRFTAKYRSEGKKDLAASILKTGFILKLIIGVTVFCICFVFSNFIAIYFTNRIELSPFIKFTSLLIIFQTIFNSLGSAFMGLDKMEGTALTSFIQATVKTALSPLLILLGLGIFGALTGHVLSYIVASVLGGLLFMRFYRKLGNPSKDGLTSDSKVIFNYGIPIYAAGLFGLIISPFQTIILAHFCSNAEIGNYAVATLLLSMLTILTVPFGVLFPAYSKVSSGSDELKRIFKRSIKYSSLIVVPSALIIAILSKQIVQILYGPDFPLAPLYLQLSLLTYFFAGFGSIIFIDLFTGIGETKIYFKANAINFFVFLPLAFILIIFYGVPGLIISGIISGLVSTLYQLNIAIKKVGTTLDFKASLKIYLTSFISAVPVLLIVNKLTLSNITSLVINSLLFLFVYLTLLPLVRAINPIDIENLTMMLKKIKIIWPILKFILDYESKLIARFQNG
ncbi:MAG: flippase [Nitrososphaeria archaeon]|jgi:O-antigen/teichoic acid export membrane protein